MQDELDLTPSPLEQLRRAAASRPDYVDLSSSNPTEHGILFPPDVLRACAEPYWRTRRYAPHPLGALPAREAIAAYYARRVPPLHVPCDQIFVTASTSEAYLLLFALLASPGDNVLAPVPAYPLFSHLAAIRGVRLSHYYLEPEGEHGWRLEPGAFASVGDRRTRALLLIAPHNPTGHVPVASLGTDALDGLPLVADEVYCDFPYSLAAVPPVGALMPDATVFHLNGISKMFALPDLKLGWIALTGPRAQDYLERLELLNDTLLGANGLTQAMLPGLFEHGRSFQVALRERVRATTDAALALLRRIPGVETPAPQAGTYLFPSFSRWDEEALVMRLLEAGLFAQPGYFYDDERGCRLVLSMLLEQPRLIAAVERLAAVVASP